MILHVFIDDTESLLVKIAEKAAKRFSFECELHPISDRKAYQHWAVCGTPVFLVEEDGEKLGWFSGIQSEVSFESNLRKIGAIK